MPKLLIHRSFTLSSAYIIITFTYGRPCCVVAPARIVRNVKALPYYAFEIKNDCRECQATRNAYSAKDHYRYSSRLIKFFGIIFARQAITMPNYFISAIDKPELL